MPDNSLFKKLAYFIIFILAAAVILLLTINIKIGSDFKKTMILKEKEFIKNISAAKEAVMKGMEEKYSADRVSYEAMSRRLEMESKKVKELEGKLKK